MTGCTVCLVFEGPVTSRFSALSGVKLTTSLKNPGHCLLTTFFLVNAILKAYPGRCYQSFTPCIERCSSFPSYISSAKSFYAKTWSQRSTTETDGANCSVLTQCTVTCGQGLRYRVVLCIDHRGLHAGGCNPTTKPHIKEECLVTVPCYKPIGGAFFFFLSMF